MFRLDIGTSSSWNATWNVYSINSRLIIQGSNTDAKFYVGIDKTTKTLVGYLISGEGKNISTDPITNFHRPRNIEIKLEDSLNNYKYLSVISERHGIMAQALLNAASLVLFKAEYVVAIVVAGLYTNVVHNMN